jgi:hypothetical protein
MSRETQDGTQGALGVVPVGREPVDPRLVHNLATNVLWQRMVTLRASLAMLIPLAVTALLAAGTASPGASTLLGVIAVGSGGMGAYIAARGAGNRR